MEEKKKWLRRYPGLYSEAALLCDRLDKIENSSLVIDPSEQADMEQQTATIIAELKEMREAIGTLRDPMERLILELRYTGHNGRLTRWKEVARKVYGDSTDKHMKAAFRLHKSALNHMKRTSHPKAARRF